ncbi:hypothetical protein H2200_006853 [Cladophialophora chaetospira]|uniref:Major facilitator superfamily (MFS) profile domain-containing protein n=1 Tax=Cladophialophora chaetospira TaxID=386627 RepID=A0AA38X944_9EURO|nr:hypothetical protein H2200_006853 [Cladophialophora chaetospira]
MGTTCLFVFLSNYITASLTPILVPIVKDFEVSVTKGSYLITFNILFLGIGNLFWVPLSLKTGKRPVLLLCSFIFLMGSVWSCVAQSWGSLLGARILQGFGASSSEALGPTVVADLYFLHERGAKVGFYTLMIAGGSALGGIFAGLIANANANWRWVFGMNTILTGINFICCALFQAETNFNRPAENESGEGLDASALAAIRSRTNGSWFRSLGVMSWYDRETSMLYLWARPFLTLQYPAVIWGSLTYGVVLGWVVLQQTANAAVFPALYGFDELAVGNINVANLVGAVVGCLVAGPLSDYLVSFIARRRGGYFKPEYRLWCLVLPFAFGPVGLMLWGSGLGRHLHYMVAIAGSGISYGVLSAVPTIGMTYVVDSYRPLAGETMTVLTAFKNAFAFALSFAVFPWIQMDGFVKISGYQVLIEGIIFLSTIPMATKEGMWTMQGTKAYYANVYNAGLLLHKPSFLQSLASGTARNHLVLSVCALGAHFYCDNNNQQMLEDSGFMLEWATRAGRLVFQEVETPTEDNVATFLNLAMFWYSQGVWSRCFTHKGNAGQILHILSSGNDRPGKEDLWVSERARRRFWAWYLMSCHAPESAIMVAERPDNINTLTLPWHEQDFERSTPTQPRLSLSSGKSNGGLYCEVIRAMTHWAYVNALLKSPKSPIREMIHAIHVLDHSVSDWWSTVPQTFQLTRQNIPQTETHLIPNILLINAVYHQCLCALHSSVVPLFSWSADENDWLSARLLSAQIAFEHACAISAVFEAVLEHHPQLAALPSFVGYAAYGSCAVQIPFLWCSEPLVSARAHTHVQTNLRIIQSIARYWKFSRLSEIYVRYLYKMHAKDPVQLENEPKYLDASKLTGAKFSAVNARQTILSFNAIIWAKHGGFAKPGEEITDLELDEDTNRHADAPKNASASLQEVAAGSVAHPVDLSTLEPRTFTNSTGPLPFAGISQQDARHLEIEHQSQNSDMFRPFLNPEMLEMFPSSEEFDFSQLEAGPFNFDVFDGWR